jgi:ParB-like chromosome segregation protein Spo0J
MNIASRFGGVAMNNLHIEQAAVADLRPNPRNARVHSAKQLHQIKASIEAFGFNNPILIDKDNLVIAGHGRLEAARLVGLETVSCFYCLCDLAHQYGARHVTRFTREV